MCTHCFEIQNAPGCTCTRRSKILTHSLQRVTLAKVSFWPVSRPKCNSADVRSMYFVARISIKKVDSFRIFQESCSLCITTKILIRKADGFVSIDFCLLLYSRFFVIKIFHFFRFTKWILQLFHPFYSCMPLV